jgi:hypothetical protein
MCFTQPNIPTVEDAEILFIARNGDRLRTENQVLDNHFEAREELNDFALEKETNRNVKKSGKS